MFLVLRTKGHLSRKVQLYDHLLICQQASTCSIQHSPKDTILIANVENPNS